MVKVNPKALKERVSNLQDRGLNGFKFVLVTLSPEDNPVQAHLEVHFHNSHELENIANDAVRPDEIFPVSGGERILAGSENGELKVVSITRDPDNDDVLNLTIKPVGDYSTYTLGINYQNIDPLFSEIDFKFRPGCFSIECDPDWESVLAPRDNPVIDYLAKDYDSFKHTLITAMMQRVPGWQPSSEADLDMVLIELFSAAADELSDYQDRVMNEAYLGTARKRVSVARHARLMDYHIHQGNQASTWLALKVNREHEIDGYALNLISIATIDELPDEGSSLVIAALVGDNLHIRIFDSDGEKIIDKAENELVSGDTLRILKQRLKDFLVDEISLVDAGLSAEDKQEIIRYAVSISGHTLIDIDLVVGTGNDINDARAIIFKSRRRQTDNLLLVEPLSIHPLLNNLGLYTWSDSVPALAAGSTSADLQLLKEDPDASGSLLPVDDQT